MIGDMDTFFYLTVYFLATETCNIAILKFDIRHGVSPSRAPHRSTENLVPRVLFPYR